VKNPSRPPVPDADPSTVVPVGVRTALLCPPAASLRGSLHVVRENASLFLIPPPAAVAQVAVRPIRFFRGTGPPNRDPPPSPRAVPPFLFILNAGSASPGPRPLHSRPCALNPGGFRGPAFLFFRRARPRSYSRLPFYFLCVPAATRRAPSFCPVFLIKHVSLFSGRFAVFVSRFRRCSEVTTAIGLPSSQKHWHSI